MSEIKFLKGTESNYKSLSIKDLNSVYITTDTYRGFLGDKKLWLVDEDLDVINNNIINIETDIDNINNELITKADLNDDGKVVVTQVTSKPILVTASKTLTLSDNGTFQYTTSTSDISITIPKDIFPIGSEIEICRCSDNNVIILGDTDVTILSDNNFRNISLKYSAVALKQVEANVWILIGALS